MRALFLRGESYWQKRIWHECLCINSHTISTSLSIHSTSKNPMAVWDLPRVLCFRVIKVMPFYQKTFFIKISYISEGLINRLKLDLVRAFVILEWDCVISRAKWFKPSLITKKAKIHQFCGWKMPILVAKSHSDGTHWICPSVPAASGRNWHKKCKYKIGCSFMYVQHTQMYDTSLRPH